jgi:hypothetical protein
VLAAALALAATILMTGATPATGQAPPPLDGSNRLNEDPLSGGGRGTANEKTSDRSISVTLTGSVSAGELLAVWVAFDNDGSSLGAFNVNVTLADSQGNVYSQLYSQAGTSGIGDGVHGGLYITQVANALTTSDTVTATYNRNVVAKAISLHRFTIGSGKKWAIVNFQPGNVVSNGADPGAVSIPATITSKTYLLLHLLAAEGPNTDGYTWDGDHTQIAGDGTTGGADDSNTHIRGGYRIATLTDDTVDVASTTADRDYVQGLVALTEVDFDSTFPNPTLSQLDDFNRANENPLFGAGKWRTDATFGAAAAPGADPTGLLQLTGNEAAVADLTHVDNGGGQYWDTQFANTDDMDVSATIADIPSDESVAQPVPLPPTNIGTRGVGVSVCAVELARDGIWDGLMGKWERDTKRQVV